MYGYVSCVLYPTRLRGIRKPAISNNTSMFMFSITNAAPAYGLVPSFSPHLQTSIYMRTEFLTC